MSHGGIGLGLYAMAVRGYANPQRTIAIAIVAKKAMTGEKPRRRTIVPRPSVNTRTRASRSHPLTSLGAVINVADLVIASGGRPMSQVSHCDSCRQYQVAEPYQ